MLNEQNILINSANAPSAIGPYSHAVLQSSRYRLEISGQSGRNPKTGLLAPDIETQTRQTLLNIEAILTEIDWGIKNIIKTRVYLINMEDYRKINEVFAEKFKDYKPARVVVGVNKLPLKEALIEIECLAENNIVSEEIKRKYNIQ